MKKLAISLNQQIPKIHNENEEMESFVSQHSKNLYQQTPVIHEDAVANYDFVPMPMDISFTQTARSTPSQIHPDQSNNLYFSKQASGKS